MDVPLFRYLGGETCGLIFFWGLAGALSHTILDILNSYGARLLWPFSKRRFTANILTLFDPVLVLGLITFLFGRARQLAYNQIPLALVFLYLVSRWLMLRRVRGVLKKKFTEGVERIAVLPSVLSIWNFAFLVETVVGFFVGDIRCFSPVPHIRRRLPKPRHTRLISQALATKLGRLFTDFTPLVHVSCQQEEDKSIVRFLDLRYFVCGDFLHSATVIFDEDQQPLEGLFHPYNPERNIKVAV